MPIFDIFPEFLLDPKNRDAFLLVLADLPIPANRKKEILIAWTRITGVALTRDIVETVLGPGVLR